MCAVGGGPLVLGGGRWAMGGVWCAVGGGAVGGVRCAVCGERCAVSVVQCVVCGMACAICGEQCVVCGVRGALYCSRWAFSKYNTGTNILQIGASLRSNTVGFEGHLAAHWAWAMGAFAFFFGPIVPEQLGLPV